MRVLLVEHDVDSLDVTAYALRREGFHVITATDGAQAVRRWENDRPDVVVLEVRLPVLDGFEVCREIRRRAATPVIMLTALIDEEYVLKGFRLGADDYVTKPFSPKQLAMRIRAVCRRAAQTFTIDTEPVSELWVGELLLNPGSHEVRCRAGVVRLTPLEFRLLHLLAINAGQVVRSARLVEYAWNYDAGDAVLLRTHFSHIRAKLQLTRDGPVQIRSFAGVGYQLVYSPTREHNATPPTPSNLSRLTAHQLAVSSLPNDYAHLVSEVGENGSAA